jgi:hypothetical protein
MYLLVARTLVAGLASLGGLVKIKFVVVDIEKALDDVDTTCQYVIYCISQSARFLGQ